MTRTMTIRLAGETEAGSAEVQPARDNRTRATNVVGMAGSHLSSHFHKDHSEPFYALENRLAEGKARSYS